MKITNGRDFWAGLMFIAFGLSFWVIASPAKLLVDLLGATFGVPAWGYSMGSAVRMGPAYFPTVLGAMLVVLGGVILLRAFISKIPHPLGVFPFRVWFVVGGLILGVIAFYTQPPRDAEMVTQVAHMLLSGLAIGLVFAAFGPKSLWVLMGAVVVFGYMLKPLGLVIATGLLIFGSALGGHEFKTREVTGMFVVLAIFSVFAFVRGLGLPMNVWPGFLE